MDLICKSMVNQCTGGGVPSNYLKLLLPFFCDTTGLLQKMSRQIERSIPCLDPTALLYSCLRADRVGPFARDVVDLRGRRPFELEHAKDRGGVEGKGHPRGQHAGVKIRVKTLLPSPVSSLQTFPRSSDRQLVINQAIACTWGSKVHFGGRLSLTSDAKKRRGAVKLFLYRVLLL